jgi:hypothetical protein
MFRSVLILKHSNSRICLKISDSHFLPFRLHIAVHWERRDLYVVCGFHRLIPSGFAQTQCRINVKLSLQYAVRHEDVWGSGGIAPSFLTSALDGGEWSASCPCRFTPRKIIPGIQRTIGRLGPKTGLKVMDKRKISCFSRESSSYSLVTRSTV